MQIRAWLIWIFVPDENGPLELGLKTWVGLQEKKLQGNKGARQESLSDPLGSMVMVQDENGDQEQTQKYELIP